MVRIWIAAACLALAALTAVAGDGKGKGKGHRNGPGRHAGVDIFIGEDRRIIHEYVAGYPRGLPPGLAKRGSLPPGLAKQLRRNGRLPPGLEKQIYWFPGDLDRRLSPLSPGLRRGFIGGHAVIVNPRKSVVVDVFVVR